MAAFFTGVVRAPLTGIVLVTEMTANVTMLLPMLGACFAAMLIPALLSDAPIYDSLREKILQRKHALPGEMESADPDLADPSGRTRLEQNGSNRP
jgi:CIC family chloride channel protein